MDSHARIPEKQYPGRNSHLQRLDREFYRGQAYVHWVLTIQDRQTGWLSHLFAARFREVLTHATFRYAVACPIYCLMPDHRHLLWIGIADEADQLNAMKYFRKQLGALLEINGVALQSQAYDHVLRDDERQVNAVENLVEYIARNPERSRFAPVDGYRKYDFTGCLLPGYPELVLWSPEYWTRFWRAYSFLQKNGLIRNWNESSG